MFVLGPCGHLRRAFYWVRVGLSAQSIPVVVGIVAPATTGAPCT
jgi:hypothetical protein